MNKILFFDRRALSGYSRVTKVPVSDSGAKVVWRAAARQSGTPLMNPEVQRFTFFEIPEDSVSWNDEKSGAAGTRGMTEKHGFLRCGLRLNTRPGLSNH